jgi:hypothetical protein
MSDTNETTITPEEALRILSRDYNEEIRALAIEALKQSEDEREDWLHETIDGHERVIYTYKARVVLICTDNPDAYEDEMGEKPAGPEQAAYMAMMTDVREMLSNRYFLADHAKGDEPSADE